MYRKHGGNQTILVWVTGTKTILKTSVRVKIHEDSCGNARNVRCNKPRDSEGCGLHRARGKRSGFLRC